LYGACAKGEEDPLPELKVQYGDLCGMAERMVEGEGFAERGGVLERDSGGSTRRYWKCRRITVGPREQSYEGGLRQVVLDEELTTGLEKLSRRHEVTLHMRLLAGWTTLMGLLSGQEEMVIGTPLINRVRIEVEGLISFFVNTLALRVKVRGGLNVGGVAAAGEETDGGKAGASGDSL
jgi:Condensation domain